MFGTFINQEENFYFVYSATNIFSLNSFFTKMIYKNNLGLNLTEVVRKFYIHIKTDYFAEDLYLLKAALTVR